MRRIPLSCLIFYLTLSAVVFGKDREVLLLNSYHQGYHWTDIIVDRVFSVLGEREDTEIQVIYMDTKRHSDPEYLELLYREYAHKYRDTRFDVILASDDHALDFLLRHGDDLFPGVPVVFCGINAFEPERIAGHGNYTGIHEDYDVKGTVELMHRLHPERSKIAVIMDSTLSSKYFLRLIYEGEESFGGELDFRYYTGLSNRELSEEMARLDDDDIILWGMHLRGGEGEFLSVSDSLELIHSATEVPIYSLWDVVGYGVVGGKVARPQEQGTVAARMVGDILDGEEISEMPVVGASLVYTFDYTVLKDYGIKLASLPAGSHIINRPFSLIRDNRTFFLILLFFILVLFFIIMFLFRDIAKRKRTEIELVKSQEELAQSRKMDAIGQLAGGVAHDFNNILTGIMGATDMLGYEENLSPESREYLEMIISSARQAADLTSQLLAFGRKGRNNFEMVDMHEIIENTLFILKQTLNRKIVISVDGMAENPIIRGNKPALQNIIMNLCINASQAMAGTGTINLKTNCLIMDRSRCNVLSSDLSSGPYLELTVSDGGPGIAPDKIDKIFEPFYTTKGRGSGLGLAAVYGTMKDHGGCISVESKEGEGTGFHLYFPQNT